MSTKFIAVNKKQDAFLKKTAKLLQKMAGPDRWVLFTVNEKNYKLHFVDGTSANHEVEQ